MVDKVFVLYDKTTGTATARPVIEFYTEDETHVPDVTLLGYTDTSVGWVMLDTFTPPDITDVNMRAEITVDPATGAQASTSVARYGVAQDQLLVLAKIDELVNAYRWTQAMDAKITKATQDAFADWIAKLNAIPNNAAWDTNPKGITIPAVPSITSSPSTVAAQIGSAEWLSPGAVTQSKLGLADFTNMVPDDQMQESSSWLRTANGGNPWVHYPVTPRNDIRSVGNFRYIHANNTAGTDAYFHSSRFFSVTAGDELYLSAQIIRSGGTKMRALAQILFYDKNDTVLSGGIVSFASVNGSTITSADYTGSTVVPSGATQARIRFFVYYADTDATSIDFGSPVCRVKSTSKMLVDKAVTTDKLDDSSVSADKLQTAIVDSRKMNISNWATLQPVWGFDYPDFSPFAIRHADGSSATPSWVVGRSGARALRVTSGSASSHLLINPYNTYSFAAGVGDTFYVEVWVRGTYKSPFIRLVGSTPDKQSGAVIATGRWFQSDGSPEISTTWRRLTAILTIPAGMTGYTWATVQLGANADNFAGRYLDVDMLSVTRLPTINNAYAQTGTVTELTATGTDIANAQLVCALGIGGSGTGFLTHLNASVRINQLSNATTDLMRTQFWIGVDSGTGIAALCSWIEFAPTGNNNHTTSGYNWVDPVARSEDKVYYGVYASKLSSVGTYNISGGAISAITLPVVA